jgi:hypothetical protein
MGNKEQGKLMTFFELLSIYDRIVIPIVQRDYAQGREKDSGDIRIEEIRTDFLDTLKNCLETTGEFATLDYIYGSVRGKDFLPIDGQQRLTTLFLLHRYFFWKENIDNESKDLFKKFTYEVRDTSTEFCKSLAEHHIDISKLGSENLSDKIKNSSWFYNSYKLDPTVSAMLHMLDCIHEKFFAINEGFKRLVSDKAIRFWQLTLEDFSLNDDLFIKMNARGKSLTRFETFKSAFEGKLDEKIKQSDETLLTHWKKLTEKWKDSIDNDWSDFFYDKLNTKDNLILVEDALFRYILIFVFADNLKKDKEEKLYIGENGKGTIDFKDLKKIIYDKPTTIFLETINNFELLISALDILPTVFASDFCGLREKIVSFVNSGDLSYDEFASIYSMLRFITKFSSASIDDFSVFYRTLNNLLKSERETDQWNKQYRSRIDRRYIGGFLSGIDDFVENIRSPDKILETLTQEFLSIQKLNGLQHEIDKAKLNVPISEIVDFENIEGIFGLIHNFISDDKITLVISSVEYNDLKLVEPGLLLRAIQCFAQKELLKWQYKGQWRWMRIDSNNQKPYDKYFFGFNSASFGDYIWTSTDKDISQALRSFLLSYSQKLKTYNGIASSGKIVHEIILDALKTISIQNPNYYYIKYPEFFHIWDSRYNHCAFLYYGKFDIYRLKGEDNKSNGQGHYNPYYLALKEMLEINNCTNKITTDLFNSWDVVTPIITLTNNIKLCLLSTGSWQINIENITISEKAISFLENGNLLKCDGVDCIEQAFKFIQSL